jgi:hypothetical protein
MNDLQRFPLHPLTKEKDTMTRSSVVAAALLVFALGAGAASAQDKPAPAGSPPAATGQPPAPATTAPAMSASEKAAIAKSCSDQANAKNLHGKKRKKFRSACKKAGGKME